MTRGGLACGRRWCGLFFFFQAEDGIRDYKVTGVQTCALPIYGGTGDTVYDLASDQPLTRWGATLSASLAADGVIGPPAIGAGDATTARVYRSEEHPSELQSPCNLVCRLLL